MRGKLRLTIRIHVIMKVRSEVTSLDRDVTISSCRFPSQLEDSVTDAGL
jgi:hypothetical protein